MRVDPDFAPPAPRPPGRGASAPRQSADPARPPRPQPGWAAGREKDPIDYDDGAWM
jgi:hypothetical protein